jgi:hypothetical protein
LVNAISIAGVPPEDVEQPISIDDGAGSSIPSSDVVDKRSSKAAVGLANVLPGKGYDDYSNAISTGREQEIREQAASSLDWRKAQTHYKQVIDLINSKEGPLTPEDMANLGSLRPVKTDPRSVIEDQYAKKLFEPILITAKDHDPDNDHWTKDAYESLPWPFEDAVAAGAGVAAKREYIGKYLDELGDVVKNQDLQQYNRDQLKMGNIRFAPLNPDKEAYTLGPLQGLPIPFVGTVYQQAKIRSLVNTVMGQDFGEVWPPSKLFSNLRIGLMSLPKDEFNEKVDLLYKGLVADNPSLARQFFSMLYGASDDTENQYNIGTAIDLAFGASLAAGLGKGLARRATERNITRIQPDLTSDLAEHVTEANRQAQPAAITTMEIGGKKVTIGALEDIKGAVSDIAANQDIVNTAPHAVAAPAIAGNLEAAGTAKAVIEINKPSLNPLENMQSMFKQRADKIRENPGNLGQEFANRIAETSEEVAATVGKTVSTGIRVDMGPSIFHTPQGVDAIQEMVKNKYPEWRNRIINILVPDWHQPLNAYTIDTILGTKTGGYFANKISAHMSAVFGGLSDFRIENKGAGAGWYIRMPRSVSQVEDGFRDLLLSHPDTHTPVSQLDHFTGLLNISGARTADEILDMANMANRKAASYVPNELKNIYGVAADSIRSLLTEGRFGATKVKTTAGTTTTIMNRTQASQWARTVNLAQDMIDPVTKKKGYSFKNIAELEYHYANQWKRLPTQLESEAYFAFMDALAMDHALRDMRMTGDMIRLGAEQYHIRVFDPKTNTAFKTEMFHGIRIPHLPSGDHAFLFPWDNLGSEKVNYPPGARKGANSVSTKDWLRFSEQVRQGKLKVVRLVHPEYYPFRDYGRGHNDKIEYVVHKDLIASPIKTGILPERGGGHLEYDYPMYGKQAIINPVANKGSVFSHTYDGDRTGMGFHNRTQANDWANEMNTIRFLISSGNLLGAKKYHSGMGATIPRMIGAIPWKDLRSDFFPKKDLTTGEINPPRWNLSEPFMIIDKDKTILDSSNYLKDKYGDRYVNGIKVASSTFRDGTTEGPGRMIKIPFTQQRDSFDVMTIKNEGTRYNPVYNYSPGEKLDPITVMNRALNRMIDSTHGDELKTTSMEHWIEAARPYLDAPGGKNDIRHSVQYYFFNGKFVSGTPKEIVNRLENQRYVIRQMIGLQNKTTQGLNSLNQRLLDSAYELIGRSPLDTIKGKTQLGFAQDIHNIPEVGKFLRAAVFHSVMFGNPGQLITQSMSWNTIHGIVGPKHSIPTMTAAVLHQISRLRPTPDVLNTLDNIATKFGWKKGQWLEARNILMSSGFSHVMGEHAVMQFGLDIDKMIQYSGARILDGGNLFFKGAERNARFGSWYGGYRLQREAVGDLKTLDNTDHLKILQSAARMMGDMDSASKSALQQGVMEFPLQFMSWNLRFAEMMMGKPLSKVFGGNSRLTWAQWSRTAAIYGLAFGMIAGPAAITGLTPFQFAVRKYANEHGYVVGDNFLTSLTLEGVFSAFGSAISGKGDPYKGTWLNFGDRYSNGVSILNDLLQDGFTLKTLLGASGSFLGGIIDQSSGLMMSMKSSIEDDGKMFPIKVEDVLNMAKVLSIGSRTDQMIYGINAKKWMSRSGNYVSDVTPTMSVLMGLTGLSPQETSDVHNKALTLADWKNAEKNAQKEFNQEVHKYLDALRNKDPDQAADYGKRAQAILNVGFRQDHFHRAWEEAIRSYNKNLIDEIDEEMYIKAAPDASRQMLLDAYQKTQARQKAQQ